MSNESQTRTRRGEPERPGEPEGKAVDVGIVVALPIEAAALRGRLLRRVDLRPAGLTVSLGRLGRLSVAVVAGGPGPGAARRATRLLIDGHRPGRIVAAGICGGLDPSLERGGLVIGTAVARCDGPYGSQRPPPRPLGRFDEAALAGLANPPQLGLVLTSGRVVASVEEKRRLRDATSAVAVDMESWWVAEEASRAGVETRVVRAVCDTALETIPSDIAALGGIASRARLAGAAARLVFGRPAAVFEMAELRERAVLAAGSLGRDLAALLEGG